MAHIVSCMLGPDLNLDLAMKQHSDISPQAPFHNLQAERVPSPTAKADRPPHVWRMHQPGQKYQLFPAKDKQTSPVAGKPDLDPEKAFALALGQNGDKTDKTAAGSALRLRMKEHNLNRRRKVSVPDLGPMTTVQEVAMDSPTIPGRPPLHERSISAPGHSFKPRPMVELTLTNIRSATPDFMTTAPAGATAVVAASAPAQAAPRQPLSPRTLAPLVIPTQTVTHKIHNSSNQTSLNRLRAGSTPVDSAIRSARTDESPRTRTPYTPLSASTALTTPKSAAISIATTISTVPTPVSAPLESRIADKPWTEFNTHISAAARENLSHSDQSSTPKAQIEARPPVVLGHRRNQSESGAIMERGRPRKRNNTPEPILGLNRSASKRSKSAERRAFEHLPSGVKPSEAVTKLQAGEAAALHRQALEQAARFEVLGKEDVDSLSKELRHLDERTEWLRRTYTSLRAGRRNLHGRICQYLRSPRTAKFSQDSMLKQEEALSELDASIDDWVTKLEQAENRRTRVRQKLLEHVAAAATLNVPSTSLVGASESLQQAMGFRQVGNISTPPRSPTKAMFGTYTPGSGQFGSHTVGHNRSQSGASSPSPQRVVAQVPSTILEQPLIEEAAAIGLGLEVHLKDGATDNADAESFAERRANMQSIRIYADSDVYALLADVESEISKMGTNADVNGAVDAEANELARSDSERKQLHRAQSHEVLSGTAKLSIKKKGSAGSLPSPTKQTDVVPTEPAEELILLTQAVFKPNESVLIL